MNITQVVKFCIKHNFHLNEFLLLYLKEKEESLINTYISKFGYNGNLSGIDVEHLKERNYLTKEVIEGKTFYKVTDKFRNLFTIEEHFIEDIYNKYPGFIQSGAKSLPVRAGEPSELAKSYLFSVAGDLDEHKEVVLDLEYALKYDLIKFSISNFIAGYYKEIRKLRKGGETNETINQNLKEE